jgi:hypothetical protein
MVLDNLLNKINALQKENHKLKKELYSERTIQIRLTKENLLELLDEMNDKGLVEMEIELSKTDKKMPKE